MATRSKKLNQRLIEGTGKAVSQSGKADKVEARRAPVVAINHGTELARLIDAHDNSSFAKAIRVKLVEISKLDKESIEQASKELRIAQYKAQAKVAEKAWTEAMATDTKLFMFKRGTRIGKMQRSLAATYSKVQAILRAFIARYNVDHIVQSTSLNQMAAMANKGGGGGGKNQHKPMSDKRFELWDKMAERLTYDDTLEKLERHILHCMKLAESKSVLLSENFKKTFNIKGKAKLKLAA